MTIAVLLMAILLLTGPKRLQPDEIVREPGEYLSPERQQRLSVSESDDGTIDIRHEPVGSWRESLYRIISRLRGDPVPRGSEIVPGQEWFVCFDEFDRLWMFIGPRGPNHHPPQSVFMFGFYFNENGLVEGAQIASSVGDWRGVPPQFFEQIPAKYDPAKWEDNPPIPSSPPGFTPSERQAADWRRR